ncbi:MAG: hypothetical protein J5615_10640 [Fibrobacter sp.]|nr:hypothetical protein [Fibrobacter sp.]
MIMRFFKFLMFPLLVSLLFACSDDDDGIEYAFNREVSSLSVLRSCGSKASGGDSCFRIQFNYPMETDRLEAIYLWLGTDVVDDTSKSVSSSQLGKCDSMLEYSQKKSKSEDTIDLTDRVKEFIKKGNYDTLQVALFCKYSKGESGAVQRTFIIFKDIQSPSSITIRDSVWSKGALLEWFRSTDQRDFHSPDEISAPITGYNVVMTSMDKDEDLRKLKLKIEGPMADTIRHARLRHKHDSIFVDSVPHSSKEKNALHFVILDGKGFDVNNDSANLFRLTVLGLRAESRYSISITSYDSAGNSSAELRPDTISTTDSIAPIMPSAIVTIEDTLFPGKGYARLDSNNRLAIFWSRSVDPLLLDHGIKVDSVLEIPKGCFPSECYDTVASYEVLRFNSFTGAWEPIRFAGGDASHYIKDYDWDDGEMFVTDGGRYVVDTIRWVSPGDTLILRIRSKDVSGYFSRALIDTIYVSPGALGLELECPEGFVPVAASDSNKFCMERFEHRNDSGEFVTNVLYSEAVAACEAISADGFNVGLCKERDWELVCLSGGYLDFGVIDDDTTEAVTYLYSDCNVGKNDSVSAADISKRKYRCVNLMGVRDMPGQFQEWAIGRSEDTAAVLKGSSYKIFDGQDRESIARCTNRSFPYYTRLAYTQDPVYLYREGTKVDTVFEKDTSRTLYAKLTKKDFKDSLQFFDVQDSNGNSVGTDYAPYAEYKKGGEEWLKSISNGLVYVPDHIEVVFFTGERISYRGVTSFYKSPSIGFRCCAYPE